MTLSERDDVPGHAWRVDVHHSMQALPEGCAALGAGAERRAFDSSAEWFEIFEETVAAPAGTVRLFTVEAEDGEPWAMLPLWTHTGEGRLRPKVLGSLSNYYTSVFSGWLREGAGTAPLVAAFRTALRSGGEWDLLRIGPMDDNSSTASALAEAIAMEGYSVGDRLVTVNWRAPVAGLDFYRYMRQRESRLRNTLVRRTRKLEREHAVRFRLVTGGAEDDLERGIRDYEAIYALSWKVEESHPEFVRGLVRFAARRGWLRLGLLDVDDRAVAAQLWITSHGTASIFKLAYDPRMENLSVGTVLSGHLFRHALDEDKVTMIDYLTGDDAYKADWMTERRVRHTWLVANTRRWKGRALQARWLAGRLIHRQAWKGVADVSPDNAVGPTLGVQGGP